MNRITLCQNCSEPIEFEENKIGEKVVCPKCQLQTTLGLVTRAQYFDPKDRFCPNCGNTVQPVEVNKGSLFVEIVLWVLLFMTVAIPLLYSIWRRTDRISVCPCCDSAIGMIPPDCPRADFLRKRYA